MQDFSYSIKSLEEAERFKNHVHEHITNEGMPDPHYVIVGAGPTGIELAGELPEYIRRVLTQHTGLPPRVNGAGKPSANAAKRKPNR